jgi:hypothetical protein
VGFWILRAGRRLDFLVQNPPILRGAFAPSTANVEAAQRDGAQNAMGFA